MTRRAYLYPYKDGCPVTKPKEPAVLSGQVGVLAAYRLGRIVGAVRYEIRGRRELYFFHLAVLSRWRCRGIGSALVKAAEEVAAKNRCRQVSLFCLFEKKLPCFYEKLGYKKGKIQKCGRFRGVFMGKGC